MFRQDFTCPALLKDPAGSYAYGAITRYGRTFQTVLLICNRTTGLFRVRSPLLAESRLMSVPPGTEMFQFPGFASPPMDSVTIPQRGGLPHSDIHGSTPARGSPWLFAACHVLHRLLVPRHPPNALLTLEITTARPARHAQKPYRDLRYQRSRNTQQSLSLSTQQSPLTSQSIYTAKTPVRPPSSSREAPRQTPRHQKCTSKNTSARPTPPHRQTPPDADQSPADPASICTIPLCLAPWPRHCHRGGGDDRIRTDDPLLAKQVLSQLSYAPTVRPRASQRTATTEASTGGPGRI